MQIRQRTSRRGFLKTTAAAASTACFVPTILPARALGAGARAAASERITVGMIGVGRQAYLKNMKQFLGMSDVQIVAVCDVDAWRLNNAKTAIEHKRNKQVPKFLNIGVSPYEVTFLMRRGG